MSACRSYLKSLFRGLLSSYVSKIQSFGICSFRRNVVFTGNELLFVAEMPYKLLCVIYSVYVHTVDDRGFLCIVSRNEYGLYAKLTGKHDHREHTVYPADIAV